MYCTSLPSEECLYFENQHLKLWQCSYYHCYLRKLLSSNELFFQPFGSGVGRSVDKSWTKCVNITSSQNSFARNHHFRYLFSLWMFNELFSIQLPENHHCSIKVRIALWLVRILLSFSKMCRHSPPKNSSDMKVAIITIIIVTIATFISIISAAL